MSQPFVIVLTGTIVPNSTLVEHRDFRQRRLEYLKAINYYRRFSTVYFLENSSYDLQADQEFSSLQNVKIRKFPVSKFYQLGKGYQEFEMLDNWVRSEKLMPSRWVKITGRYIITNFAEIFSDCIRSDSDEIIIEQRLWPSTEARTELFCISTATYENSLLGIYNLCDDSKGVWIEHVVRSKIRAVERVRTFKALPLIVGVSGTTGVALSVGWRKRLKYYLYPALSIVSRRYRLL